MKGWQHHVGTAIALNLENVDTDQIIPARFMSTPRADGYGNFLFHDLRRTDEGQMDPTFPLNRSKDISVLVAGRNFGSGSSREAAVYALVDFGIQAVIAPGFGDIFAANAVNNGLLPARVTPEAAARLFDRLASDPGPAEISLGAGVVQIHEISVEFSLSQAWREKLMKGWDDIDLTQVHGSAIDHFRKNRRTAQPWAFPLE